MGKFDGKIADYPLGERIRYLRKDRGLSQVQIANAIGLSQGAVSQIEKGQMNLSLSHLRSISQQLRVHPAVLLADDNVFVFDTKVLGKYSEFSDLPPALKRGVIKTLRLFRKWGLK